MKYLLKFSLFFLFIIWPFLSIHHVQAIFHDEGWNYYLQNTKTWEIKYFNLQWDIWNGWLNEINDNKIDRHAIPVRNYFDNWDLIWYNYNWRGANLQCNWEANWLKLNVETRYWLQNAEWNPCKQIPRIVEGFTVNDLSEFDKLWYYRDFLIFLLPSLILGILFNFFVAIPVSKYVLKLFKKPKPIYIIYVSLILSVLFAIISVSFWFTKIEVSWTLFWSLINLFYSIYRLPFYIWWAYIFMSTFVTWKFSYFKSPKINTFISFIFIFFIFFALFIAEITSFTI